MCLQEQFILQYTEDSYKLIVEDDIYNSAHYTTVEGVVLSCQKKDSVEVIMTFI